MLFSLSRVREWFVKRNLCHKNRTAPSSLMARVSYELRTSLNGIVRYAEFLEARTVEPMMNFTAKIIRESGSNLARASTSYFDLQYLQLGQAQLVNTEINFADLLSELVGNYQSHALERSIHLHLFCSPNALPLCIYSDEARLRQVLDALIFNNMHIAEKWNDIHVCLSVDESQKFLLLSIEITFMKLDKGKLRLEDEFWNSDTYEFHLEEGPGVEMALAKALIGVLGYAATYHVTENTRGTWQLKLPSLPKTSAI